MPPPKLSRPHLIVLLLLALIGVAHGTGVFQSTLGLAPPASIALVILLGTAILWVAEVIPLYVTSMAVLFFQIIWLLPAITEAGMPATRNDFLIAFFSDITLLFMGGFVLAALMNKYRLSDMLARKILRRTGTKPSAVLLSIILVSSLLSMWMSNTATAAMMFAIIAPPAILETTRPDLPISVIQTIEDAAACFENALPVLPIDGTVATPGQPDQSHAKTITTSIENAVGLTLSGDTDAVVTNPIAKEILYQAGFSFPGHTEYLGALCEDHASPYHSGPVMMLTAPDPQARSQRQRLKKRYCGASSKLFLSRTALNSS